MRPYADPREPGSIVTCPHCAGHGVYEREASDDLTGAWLGIHYLDDCRVCFGDGRLALPCPRWQFDLMDEDDECQLGLCEHPECLIAAETLLEDARAATFAAAVRMVVR
jgi:hypothetical protein